VLWFPLSVVFLSSIYCSQCPVDVDGRSVVSYWRRADVSGFTMAISLAPYLWNVERPLHTRYEMNLVGKRMCCRVVCASEDPSKVA
jgi:hypothetical protein